MSTAYDNFDWGSLFLAAAGASAALAGLLFVAVSINIERILKFDGLPERALETLMFLMLALFVSMAVLVPEQSHVALGIELFVLGILVLGAAASLPHGYTRAEDEPQHWRWGRWGIRLAATVPFIVAGASLVAEAGGGLYWAAAGVALATFGAVTNAWVLLVEILR